MITRELQRQAGRLGHLLREQWDRAWDRSVRLAVTGLSQSGKTVFITSLVNQLLHLRNLPFLGAVSDGRVLAARIAERPDARLPAFPYADSLAAFTGAEPRWPAATDRISEIRIDIRFRSAWLVAELDSVLHLDIVDYPGEWLLDLPLLDLSYGDWSRQVLALCEQPPRATLAREWLDFVGGLRLGGPADEGILHRGQTLYAEFLARCKEAGTGLSHLQPGRFLMPGDLKDAPVLHFFPCPPPAEGVQPGSLYEALAQRYESYKERVVTRFYQDEVARFDRQVVVVDLLRALNTGHHSYVDMRRALEAVLQSFSYGPSGLIQRLFQSRIDRLLFAATKADQVSANQRGNLRALLEATVDDAAREVSFRGVDYRCLPLASVVCTESVPVPEGRDGQVLSCLKGRPKGAAAEEISFPGEVPPDPPAPEAWDTGFFRFRDYELPPLAGVERHGLPHINLDKALDFLIGDKLR